MADTEAPSARVVAGCTRAAWSLFLMLPLWFAWMFGIMQQIDPPQWVWVVFWIYVPVAFIGGMLSGIIKVLGDAKV